MPTARTRVGVFLPLLNRYMAESGINTGLRAAHYLGQIAHESGELRYTEELGSGAAYEGRRDLGNIHRGDGRRFKGRGVIQLTGRANYEAYRRYCGFDVVARPELLSRPLGAVRSSCWYWRTKGLNALADDDDFIGVTRRINGGLNGYGQRLRYLRLAKEALL